MIKKICCALLLAGALLPPPTALAWDGYRCCDWRGGVWGGRRAWDGGYGWRGSGYYVPPYGWPGGHGGACWRWWYGQWVWSC